MKRLYPQLARLQNSWKNSGWEYRFYTDKSGRAYIAQHYPSRFVDAFDALVPGAYKADLFRYLVLLKDGGVYADIDVMLDTTLETFISPSISFFVPRDLVADYADENFCLWNGLMGAAPGHPFLVRAVERLVNLILNRADLYDMQRDICRSGSQKAMEIWKSMEMPVLLLSGPCALGVSVNDALGNGNPLTKFSPGWLPPITADSRFGRAIADAGDALILMADKMDQGAFRFTDVERNIIVASTDLPDLSKTPLHENVTKSDTPSLRTTTHKKEKKHYSSTSWDPEASKPLDVYTDIFVINEAVKLQISFDSYVK